VETNAQQARRERRRFLSLSPPHEPELSPGSPPGVQRRREWEENASEGESATTPGPDCEMPSLIYPVSDLPVLATCGIQQPVEVFENTQSHLLLLADFKEEE
jgi:hypothetical protein